MRRRRSNLHRLMDELRESAYYAKPGERIFKNEPFLLYLLTLSLGIGCSAIFPDLAGLMVQKGYSGIKRALPHL